MEGSTPITQPLVVQVVSNIQPFGNQEPKRYRCMVSDGSKNTAIAVLSNTMTALVDQHQIARYTVLRVSKGNASKKPRPNETPVVFLIVVEAEILGTLEERIDSSASTGVAMQQAPPQQPQQNAQFESKPQFQAPPQQQYQQQQFQNQNQGSNPMGSFMARPDQPKPSFGASVSGTAVAPVHTGPPPPVHPIGDLNPYHNKWTIRARVTQKTNIKSWNKPTSSGRLFSVNLLDESGEIRATAFTQQVDKLFPLLEVGKVYYVSNAQVKMARQQFSNVNNQYELTFDDNSVVELCTEQGSVPQEHFDFIRLDSLGKFEKNHVLDVLAVVREVGDVTEITAKADQRKMRKRELTLVDQSGYQVRMTLWGDDADSFAVPGEPVLAFKGARVGDFGGRTLSLPSMGSMTVNPDIPAAHQLRGWYDAGGRTQQFQSYGGSGGSGGGQGDSAERFEAQLKTMAQVRDEHLGEGEGADYFYLKGTIAYIRSNSLSYPGCPGDNCSKKVVENQSSGDWYCEKCQRSYAAPNYRYIFSVNVSDETGQTWVQCFDEIGQVILGQSANVMAQYQTNDEASFKRVLEEATFKEFKFRCRAKTEMFNENRRVRVSAVGIYPIDYVAEAKRLTRLIESYSQ
ncbi:Replication factor A protein 1 [Coemansia erecta]|uniref:Replication protein A subunit n=1 Tax=Coemansia erecta TaxID=147472 RepID=A0A9W7Y574_9FUNG|nr:Replication factor A protein 1 [Coemansia erecta]